MPLSDLKNCHKVIGTKQVKKAIAKGQAQKVYIARDAEPYIIEPIKELCQQHQISYELAEDMEKLGKACGIDVGAATAAVLDS